MPTAVSSNVLQDHGLPTMVPWCSWFRPTWVNWKAMSELSTGQEEGVARTACQDADCFAPCSRDWNKRPLNGRSDASLEKCRLLLQAGWERSCKKAGKKGVRLVRGGKETVMITEILETASAALNGAKRPRQACAVTKNKSDLGQEDFDRNSGHETFWEFW